MISTPGQIVINMETPNKFPGKPAEIEKKLNQEFNCKAEQLKVFGKDQWTAPVASGTGVPNAMVICPCTMGTLAAVAQGLSNNLIERAADVVIKERKTLIVVPRESPFSTIHLENMLRLSNAGAVILPPNPGFYQNPKTLDDIVDFVVARILDHLEIAHSLVSPWGLDKE
jgi:4-hydroxy-3-polyprenylbenzoate decarboxylase